MQIHNPPEWPRPRGYSNGVSTQGRQVFIAGQVGWNPLTEQIETEQFAGQVRQALSNIIAVLKSAGGRPEHIVRMTWFITHMDEYISSGKEIGRHYRDIIGRHYPVMSAIGIKDLLEEGAKVEIEATAVIPDGAHS